MNSKLDKYKNIFNPTGCISAEQILKYHKKSLSKKEIHEVERHLLDCQLCSDALEGFAAHDNQEIIIGEIKNAIRSRTYPVKTNLKLKTIAIAAFLTISFGISFLIYKKITDSEKHETLVTEAENNKTSENNFSVIKQDSSIAYKEESKEADEVVKKYSEAPQNNLIAIIPEKKKELLLKKEDKILDVPAYSKQIAANNSDEVPINIEERSNNADTLSESAYTATDESKNLAEAAGETEIQTTEKLELGKTYFAAPSMGKNKSMESKKAEQAKSSAYKELSEPESVETLMHTSDNLLSIAIEKYNRKEYNKALEIFKSIIQNKPANDEVIYYTALSYYNIQDYKMAAKYFEMIIKNKKSSFFEDSQWQLALSYIGNNEINKAKKLLILIVEIQGKYELEAQQQLEKMK